jgi:hypothetical protein
MDNDDPEARIAELERQVAEQKRIAELERQLAEAKAASGQYQDADQAPRYFNVQGHSGAADDARRYAESLIETINTGHSPAPNSAHWQKPRRTWTGANRLGAVAGAIGGCIGGAAALTAVFPSTALWTSPIVCGGPNQLMVNTSHYSYKPGQSGTTVDFQCLAGDGAHEANFATISALQTLVVGLALAGVLAIGFLIRRIRRSEPVRPASAVIAGAVGLSALAVVAAIFWQGFASSSSATQMPHGGTLSIRGNGDSQTIACNDGHLSIDGREMTVTVTGHCARLSVDGVIHHITVDSVDAIDVDGINNVVTYHSGSPKITRSGGQNTVQQG